LTRGALNPYGTIVVTTLTGSEYVQLESIGLQRIVVSTQTIANLGGGGSSVPYVYTPLGYDQLTSLSTPTLLSSVPGGIPAGAVYAFIDVSGAAVRYRDDGVAPTASVGMPVAINTQLQYFGNLAAIEFIQQAAGAVLDISFYK